VYACTSYLFSYYKFVNELLFLSLLIFPIPFFIRAAKLYTFSFSHKSFFAFFFPFNLPLKAAAKVDKLFVFSKCFLNFFIPFSEIKSLTKRSAKVKTFFYFRKIYFELF